MLKANIDIESFNNLDGVPRYDGAVLVFEKIIGIWEGLEDRGACTLIRPRGCWKLLDIFPSFIPDI